MWCKSETLLFWAKQRRLNEIFQLAMTNKPELFSCHCMAKVCFVRFLLWIHMKAYVACGWPGSVNSNLRNSRHSPIHLPELYQILNWWIFAGNLRDVVKTSKSLLVYIPRVQPAIIGAGITSCDSWKVKQFPLFCSESLHLIINYHSLHHNVQINVSE